MKSFIKNNSQIITKMFVMQIGITVLGYLLYLAASVSENRTLVLGLGIFSALFFLFLIYVHVWDLGTHDKIKIDGNRLTYDSLKGLKIALFANSLNIFLALLSTIGYLCIDRSVSVDGVFTTPSWACSLYAIAQIIGQFLNSMYTGIGDYLGIMQYPWFLFVLVIPSLITTTVAYILGTKEKFGILASGPKNPNY